MAKLFAHIFSPLSSACPPLKPSSSSHLLRNTPACLMGSSSHAFPSPSPPSHPSSLTSSPTLLLSERPSPLLATAGCSLADAEVTVAGRLMGPPNAPAFGLLSRFTCRATRSEAGTANTINENRERLVQHVLVKEDQLELLQSLQHKVMQEGADLSDLATEYSICSSKSEGGLLGWIRKGQTMPEFEKAAFHAPLNKLVQVKTKCGWHLLQVLSEREISFLQEIQPEELYTRLQDTSFPREAQLIDVREPFEISVATIKGFKPFPLSQFGQWAPTIATDLDPSKDTYLLCHHGVRSLQAAQWLQTQGFQRLYNVAGGIHAYSMRVDKSVPVY